MFLNNNGFGSGNTNGFSFGGTSTPKESTSTFQSSSLDPFGSSTQNQAAPLTFGTSKNVVSSKNIAFASNNTTATSTNTTTAATSSTSFQSPPVQSQIQHRPQSIPSNNPFMSCTPVTNPPKNTFNNISFATSGNQNNFSSTNQAPTSSFLNPNAPSFQVSSTPTSFASDVNVSLFSTPQNTKNDLKNFIPQFGKSNNVMTSDDNNTKPSEKKQSLSWNEPFANNIVNSEISMDPINTISKNDKEKIIKQPDTEDEIKLSQLNAQIEEKKKRLLERMEEKKRKLLKDQKQPSIHSTSDITALAERNAARFSNNANVSTFIHDLPSDLQSIAQDQQDQQQQQQQQQHHQSQENCNQSTSLIGTCPYMCPNEELLKRQKENDIQLLEMLSNDKSIHPKHWTLRDTTVKRFRRSAADFKLDIPELVRNPKVLEMTCSYLEEWVMERDRQGPDPRYCNNNNTNETTPTPMDVYQFIWDRTRMIRKDFILQNYQANGTVGGKCSATSVRVHERIARWHAMMEHQLSHISEFVHFHSQQNIQELGQTMKTLNLYYDDNLTRSVKEEKEYTNMDKTKDGKTLWHGCTNDQVQGPIPLDYDGTQLNAKSINSRIIGKECKGINNATAEPEMRALYILLTMDNDGGMEVLKYAGALCAENPMVYKSAPVQLALNVYKAKKEHNYARFFSILRSTSTPYLFSCVMFKYVEHMRKVAFQLMYKIFGARSGTKVKYDAYPIKDLVHLLCFEDENEAIAACKHYNITVKKDESQTMILWKHSSFREAKDVEKGTTMRLIPRKMIRTIEKKVNGSTRLAICRGDLSGNGSTLSRHAIRRQTSLTLPSPPKISIADSSFANEAELNQEMANKNEREALDAQHESQQAQSAPATTLEEEKKKTMELETERQRNAEVEAEQQRKRNELLKKIQIEREREEQERKQAELQRKQAELQRKQAEQQRIQAQQQRKQAEELRKQAEAAAAAAAAERKRIEKLKIEEKEKERRAKIIEEERIAKEIERQRRLEFERVEKQRKLEKALQEEKKRQLKLEQERLEREKKEREREAIRLQRARRKKAEKFQLKMEHALLKYVCNRWKKDIYGYHFQIKNTQQSLSRINHSFAYPASNVIGNSETNQTSSFTTTCNIKEGIFYRLIETTKKLNLSEFLGQHIVKGLKEKEKLYQDRYSLQNEISFPRVVLCKVAIIIPFSNKKENSMKDAIISFVHNQLCFGQVKTKLFEYDNFDYEVRTVAVNDSHNLAGSDIVLVVIPPFTEEDIKQISHTKINAIEPNTIRMVLVLDDESKSNAVFHKTTELINLTFENTRSSPNNPNDLVIVNTIPEDSYMIASTFQSCYESLIEKFCDGLFNQINPFSLKCINLVRLCRICICEGLQKNKKRMNTKSKESNILNLMKAIIEAISLELKTLRIHLLKKPIALWPPDEFAVSVTSDESVGAYIPNYFGKDKNLPLYWLSKLDGEDLYEKLLSILRISDFSAISTFVSNILIDAPIHIKQKCQTLLEQNNQCLSIENALLWLEHKSNLSGNIGDSSTNIFLPALESIEIVERILQQNGNTENSYEPKFMLLLNDSIISRTGELSFANHDNHKQEDTKEKAICGPMHSKPTYTIPPNASNKNQVHCQRIQNEKIGSSIKMPSEQDKIIQDNYAENNDATNLMKVGHKRKQIDDCVEQVFSRQKRQSSKFTMQLKTLLDCKGTVDMKIGNIQLATIISNDVLQISNETN